MLTQYERHELGALLSGGKQAARKLKRAQILLAADAGVCDEEIAAVSGSAARPCTGPSGGSSKATWGGRWPSLTTQTKIHCIGSQQVGRCPAIADRRIGQKVDDGYVGRHLVQHRPHLPNIGTMQSEIREQHNHNGRLALSPSALCNDSALSADG